MYGHFQPRQHCYDPFLVFPIKSEPLHAWNVSSLSIPISSGESDAY